ncbi:MAG: hypothetical protein IJ917_08630 [Firmicutes bacterium]|nr:hypothetical protein [Bacillota bacterium]
MDFQQQKICKTKNGGRLLEEAASLFFAYYGVSESMMVIRPSSTGSSAEGAVSSVGSSEEVPFSMGFSSAFFPQPTIKTIIRRVRRRAMYRFPAAFIFAVPYYNGISIYLR